MCNKLGIKLPGSAGKQVAFGKLVIKISGYANEKLVFNKKGIQISRSASTPLLARECQDGRLADLFTFHSLISS
jgi:hypothetical protein